MKRAKRWALVVVCVLTGIFFVLYMNQSKDSAPKDDFFFWIDGYVCFPVNTPYSLAFTYCYGDAAQPLSPEDISEIEVTGFDNITCRLSSAKQEDEMKYGYHATIYTLEFESNQLGEYSIHELTFIGTDGSKKTYPIGNWVFDFDVKPPEPYETIYGGGGVTSSGDKYMYEFNIPDQCKLLNIYYWRGASVDGSDHHGEVALDQSSAPVKVVRPKLELEINGKPQISYGSVSYCGALNVTEDDFETARIHGRQGKDKGTVPSP